MFAFEAMQAAIEQAESLAPADLLMALKALDIMTIGGRLHFDPKTGQGTLNPFPTQIQNGKYVTLWPKEIALVPIVMAMLGGVGHVWGPVLGAFFITLVEELLWTRMPYLHLTTYGVILLLVGFYLPGGLVRLRWLGRLRSRSRA
jgi:hypothetical protein